VTWWGSCYGPILVPYLQSKLGGREVKTPAKQKIAGSNPASGHLLLLPSERRSELASERLCNQVPSVYCGALKHGAS